MKKILLVALAIVAFSCKNKSTEKSVIVENSTENKTENTSEKKAEKIYNFDLEGHRGTRGLMPENSIPAFKKALELGVNTLEMDVVITEDKKVLVSHDLWFNRDFCLDSVGKPIAEKDSMSLNIYQHTYAEVQKYDCGSIGNPKFPEQEKQHVTKPLLKDVFAMAENFKAENNVGFSYNIELKSDPRADNLYHPEPKEFSELVIKTIENSGIPKDRIVLQSFDFRILQYLHEAHPEYRLSALVYQNGIGENLEKLGFIPAIYSPEYKMISEESIDSLHQKEMKVIPWTVNDTTAMKQLLEWKVDGVITDYPNRALPFRS
ncbi:glycerophosphodiester phosphodiesterase family protein [Zunongwangia sp. HGR-M22]|uniref:glycerophosphodiester phosphodiesterase family protein n=1 Tax=Zunongwangia sp. HGR-M22 TaxID=3015168 RepID=UPI0022DD79A0|nr:glycerophosphodiester phosphodiesterase family protein [Zunongwangia sp. HGR-M22]WBL27019.1 glycerophosphodiester phosphodiesterase family protein [Zunongwangia sp. HGR-M22]